MIRLDFTDPATLQKLAALPYYGFAEALIRRVDPKWKVEPCHLFDVKLERGGEDCPLCGCSCSAPCEVKNLTIEAEDEDEAERIAERDNKGWFVVKVEPTIKPATASVPERYLQQFEIAA